jgi:minor histocompatibility antigen H13
MTGKDAAMFPIIASCTLFGIYIIFQVSIANLGHVLDI